MPENMPAQPEKTADIDLVGLIETLRGLVSRARTIQSTLQIQGDEAVAQITDAGEAATSAIGHAQPRSTRRDGYNPSGRLQQDYT